MSDLLDVLHPRTDEVFTGTYYEALPVGQKEGAVASNGVRFTYDTLDPTSWAYQQLIQNVTVNDATTAAIKTKAPLAWRVGGCVATQDGKFYEIAAIGKDYNAAPKQAFRTFAQVAGTSYVLRLREKSNPWGLK